MKHQAKDYSVDPRHNDWSDQSINQISRAALLAQGNSLPPLPNPEIVPYPKHVSITQHPNYMTFDNHQNSH